eukprot:gnl/MRDRNA2_/MRDRNA2_30180_c0_seq1.p1 gnl/MRDRNA2_/MRDRNA2_30180_c0~~gnl/MRDRNA2_/MRDRNA2_30180_c0_seq1.p1  ORF type:complete len:467 (+),score=91.02 gnl/MRDRNA2_/MRDRNA2_30180_c0_seq1:66-1403(+)
MPHVTFHVQVSTKLGEEVRLVGSSPQLGCWKPAYGVPLWTTPDTYPVWKSQSIYISDGVEYKYVVIRPRPEGHDLHASWGTTWEECSKRRIPYTSGQGCDTISVEECFGDNSICTTTYANCKEDMENQDALETEDMDNITTKLPNIVAKLEEDLAKAKADLAKANADLAKANREIATMKMEASQSIKPDESKRTQNVKPDESKPTSDETDHSSKLEKRGSSSDSSVCMIVDLTAQELDEADAEYYPPQASSDVTLLPLPEQRLLAKSKQKPQTTPSLGQALPAAPEPRKSNKLLPKSSKQEPKTVSLSCEKRTEESTEAPNEKLWSLIIQSPVMLFIKGDAGQPNCGRSAELVKILKDEQIKFSSFDVSSDMDVRDGLKAYSKWPTYPQLFVDGKLVGGLDTVKELQKEGVLEDEIGLHNLPVAHHCKYFEELASQMTTSPIVGA